MMEPKFIELHTRDRNSGGGDPMSVNVEAIQCFHPDPDHQMPDKPGVVEATDGSFYTVTESYDEIKQLIHDSGILIHRADPRLNAPTALMTNTMTKSTMKSVRHFAWKS